MKTEIQHIEKMVLEIFLVPKIKSDFYFDFRPVNNLRFYAKAKFKISLFFILLQIK